MPSAGRSQRRSEPICAFSFDMLGEGARTMDDADRYFASYQHAIRMLAQTHAAATDAGPADTDGISIKLSALPRAMISRSASACWPSWCRVSGSCEMAANARINLTIDAEEVDRLELSSMSSRRYCNAVADWLSDVDRFRPGLQVYQTRSLSN